MDASAETKKRILYVITKSNLGGAQRYVYDLATNLSPHLYDVAIAAGGSGLLTEKLMASGIRVYPIPSFERDISIMKEFKAFSELSQVIKEFRPDIIHLNSSKAGGLGALVARMHRVPKIVFTAHGWPFNERRSYLWRKMAWFLSWMTALLVHEVILVSEFDKETSGMKSMQKKFTVIRTGIPRLQLIPRVEARNQFFEPGKQQIHANDFWLASIAELTRNKNLETAIRAVEAYNLTHERKIFYVIMGEGEEREKLENIIGHSPTPEQFSLFGFIDGAPRYLSAFDGFLLTSEKEGTPYVILEAASARLPVIASRVGGVPEMIRDRSEGILIDPHDIQGIVKALERIVGFRGHAEILASTLQNRVHNEFSLKRMVEATQTRYLHS